MATTQAPTTQVDTLSIAAEPERVCQALTDPVQQDFHRARIEVARGGRQVLGPAGELWGDDPMLECDELRRLVHGWPSVDDPECADEPASRVAWDRAA